jgi:hypothetical protein
MSCLMLCSLRNSVSRSRMTSAFSLAALASLARRMEFSSRKRRTSADGLSCSSWSTLLRSSCFSSCNRRIANAACS